MLPDNWGKFSAVNARRLALYIVVLVLLAALGLALALGGLFACAPPPLPGDELWTWRQNFGTALGLVFRAGSTTCFTADPAGGAALWIGAPIAGVLLIVLAAIVLGELVGREARRAWFRSRGGHLLLAGTPDDVSGLAHTHPAPTAYLAPDHATASEFARRHPFREAVEIDGK